MSVRPTTQAELRNRCGDMVTPEQRRRWKYCAVGQQKDPYDATPDAYDTFHGYGETEAAAYADLHDRMSDQEDW